MARKQHHEEHLNHEAWAIPYGDLVTLLLAFFVVMYAISSINEGKYRVVADALSSAFGGAPRSVSPIQLGKTQLRGSSFDRPSLVTPGAKAGPTSATVVALPKVRQMLDMPSIGHSDLASSDGQKGDGASRRAASQLQTLGERLQKALAELMDRKLVTVRRGHNFLEVEIKSDILFASGSADLSVPASETVSRIGNVLSEEANAVRVEGYTDNLPISTVQFRSNWELSSARAASVVHRLVSTGVAPQRLAAVGFGEYQPIADNANVEGRNANRRVLLVILAAPLGPDSLEGTVPGTAVADTLDPAPLVPGAPATPQPVSTESQGGGANVMNNPLGTR